MERVRCLLVAVVRFVVAARGRFGALGLLAGGIEVGQVHPRRRYVFECLIHEVQILSAGTGGNQQELAADSARTRHIVQLHRHVGDSCA